MNTPIIYLLFLIAPIRHKTRLIFIKICFTDAIITENIVTLAVQVNLQCTLHLSPRAFCPFSPFASSPFRCLPGKSSRFA